MTCWLCGFKENSVLPTCKNVPCRICVEVVKVDEEINQALAILRSLHAKRCELRSEQNRAHDPMHQLPLEIQSDIFKLILPTWDEWGRTCLWGKKPLFLASICKGWRDIVRSIPSVWSTFTISLGMGSKYSPSLINFVHNWILHSRTLPLTLHISVPDNVDSEDDLKDFEKKFYGVLEVISKYPNEWQTLSLDIPTSFLHILHDSDTDFRSHLLTVKAFSIRCTDHWKGPDQSVSPSNLTMKPEKIEICGFSFQSFQFSWNHLTAATIKLWDLRWIAQLFQQASQMTYCCISKIRRTPNFVFPPPIIHRKLQTFKWYGLVREDLSVFLDSLTLPCLRAIQMTPWIIAKIPALVLRSSCPLTRITLLGGHLIDLLPNLRSLPGVTDLGLEQADYDGAVNDLLFNGYFPNLRCLTLPVHIFLGLWHAGTIPKLLGSRLDAPNQIPFHKIFVPGVDRSRPGWNPEVGNQLEVFQSCINWREDGLEILMPGAVSGDEARYSPVLV